MSNMYARRYAEILSKGDVMKLFQKLQSKYGTIADVCERIGIERKTFYNWKSARRMSLETKEKVIVACLEDYPLDTLEFIADRLRQYTVETLSILINTMLHLLTEEPGEDPRKISERLQSIKEKYSVPLTLFIAHEIKDLEQALSKRGITLEYSLQPTIRYYILESEERRYAEPASMSTAALDLDRERVTHEHEHELQYAVNVGEQP